jgi:hypothetical protein
MSVFSTGFEKLLSSNIQYSLVSSTSPPQCVCVGGEGGDGVILSFLRHF